MACATTQDSDPSALPVRGVWVTGMGHTHVHLIAWWDVCAVGAAHCSCSPAFLGVPGAGESVNNRFLSGMWVGEGFRDLAESAPPQGMGAEEVPRYLPAGLVVVEVHERPAGRGPLAPLPHVHERL